MKKDISYGSLQPEEKDFIPELLWLIYDYETEEFDRTHCHHVFDKRLNAAIVSHQHQGRSTRHAKKWMSFVTTLSNMFGVHCEWLAMKSKRRDTHSHVKSRLLHLSPTERELYDEMMRICTQMNTSQEWLR